MIKKVNGVAYYTYTLYNNSKITDVFEWCNKQFGIGGTININSEWFCMPYYDADFHNVDTYYFKKEEDVTWFIMRWSACS
jgi:hypothetical protein